MQTVQNYTTENRQPARKKTVKRDFSFSAFASITEQNAADAAFLWLLRSQAVRSALYFPADVRELEGRIEANLEGILAVGELGWQVCVDQLAYEEAGEVFTAAVVAFRTRNASRIKMVCELALTSDEMTEGLISALGWIETEIASFWIQRFLSVTDPRYRMLGLAACSVRREDPGKYLVNILQDPAIQQQMVVHARALRLIGELKRIDLLPALNAAMDAEAPGVRFWANWSAVLLGNQNALPNLKPYTLELSEYSLTAVQLVFSALSIGEARQWVTAMVAKPELHRLVIIAIGILGDPHAVPWLIQQMKIQEHARIAAWAFSQITGITLETAGLATEPAEDIETGPSDESDEEDVAMDEDEELPWPDVERVARLWQVHYQLLQPGQRYFQGQEVTKQVLAQIFVGANQQQKELAALQRAVLDRNTPLVNTQARER